MRTLWKTLGLCLCRVFAVISVALFDTPAPAKGGDPEAIKLDNCARTRAVAAASWLSWSHGSDPNLVRSYSSSH